MRLWAAADAGYLGEPKARSRAGGVLWLGDDQGKVSAPLASSTAIISLVVASAAEAEYAALQLTGTQAVWARTILCGLGYEQKGPTTLFTDNDCARNLASRNAKQRKTKGIDMKYHWTRSRVDEGILRVARCPGGQNPADFLTKAHSPKAFADQRVCFADGRTGGAGAKLPVVFAAMWARSVQVSTRRPAEVRGWRGEGPRGRAPVPPPHAASGGVEERGGRGRGNSEPARPNCTPGRRRGSEEVGGRAGTPEEEYRHPHLRQGTRDGKAGVRDTPRLLPGHRGHWPRFGGMTGHHP